MAQNELYVAEVTTVGGRNGHSTASDGAFDLHQAIPTAMGGPGGSGKTNPEQLLAAAWSGCFGTSIAAAASIRKVRLAADQVRITARVRVLEENGAFSLGGELLIQQPEGMDRATLEQLVQDTQNICAYSKLLHAANAAVSYRIV